MKLVFKINWILIIVLSLSTGIFKVIQQEADVLLFEKIGFNTMATTLLGIVQVVGGMLLIPILTRKYGAYIMIATFIIASMAVFANKMIAFGVVSLLFILMPVGVVLMMNKKSEA